ncbi:MULTISPECIES: glycoside hydrolase family 65 protein [unclassified Mycolicibacterium]|uniref:glycoside hydrolase family 65 protein n=1 Tax=unclassified Mycolicibacterium TaxID=2636767 RepID=UPI0012DEC04F|nr:MULTISPECIES: glycoside hydrolase family 65 protein [unclassified Mycolicibacterium]MUL81230.1 glycoside hydrolase family 65 protein [Mycolicibacterium sp. CBMA 329]MUL86996.1 glycoside hydrolase family 65 protein [Mycolicibacterium sp. CBMA 331]MUL98721.1 glycoside hydrolase family 65 protein [Mycolicibacterium sp. CBMA 334]MUM25584.1 glycoside hydrolase family 65 protein [Mycolicibacterium sp. CBMA 295]MUM37293.1 glycoside hydrolase family 65 protein [Mycolicibacterium sp. CBMA 247]
MITHDAYPVEPWQVRETRLDVNLLAQSESLFALSNGHIGLRGNLDEGEPHGLPGTYLAGFFEVRPLPYAEAGFGYPEAGQTIVDVTNGKLLRLLVDDEPFDVRYGDLIDHERTLDLRAGTLTRVAHWRSPAGKQIRVVSTRLVSFAHRGVAAIEYTVEAIDEFVRVTVQSELVTNEDQPETSGDPRVSAVLKHPLQAIHHEHTERGALLVHRTRGSGLMMAAAMNHDVEVPGRVEVSTDSRDDLARTTVICGLRAGQKLRIVKYLAYGWSSLRSRPALIDQAAGAITGARYSGWLGLLDSQRAYLDEFWDSADVEVEGDPDCQQAVRFGLFHVLQASARAERRAIAGKGLTGTGYDGHSFWDTEGFVLPVLTYTKPQAAADALRWRASTLDLARDRAALLDLKGASFPWRTIRGEECSAYWPAGTAAWHINADIAAAFERYRVVTGDDSLEHDCGLEVLVDTARLWMSLGHHDRHGIWHLDAVTGPDEYTAVVRDNVFTNLMAAHNLRVAADACTRHPDASYAMGVTTEETAAWRDAAEAAHIPYDDELGVHPQCAGFTTLAEWNFSANTSYPLLLHEPYVRLYPAQVLKQADLVLAMQWQSHAFTPEQKARNVDYYERRTTRDSSLSACTQAVMCAEVGHLELAHDYTYEAALIDLRDLQQNTRDGLHMASLAGAWTALVAGFGGLRDDEGILSLDPHLPDGILCLRFRLRWKGFRLTVEAKHRDVTYILRDGPDGSLTIRHAGDEVVLNTRGSTTVKVIPRHPSLPPPPQPPGREPVRRRSGHIEQ